jgi:TonB family protein
MTLLLAFAIRSSIVLLIGLAASALLRTRSAAVRHCVLAGAIVAAAAVVPLSLAIPAWELDVPRRFPAADAAGPPAMESGARAAHVRIAIEAPPPASPGPPLAIVVWLAGALVSGAMLAIGMGRLTRIAARARPVRQGPWASLARTLASEYGIRRRVIVLQTDAAHLLATWGVLRPRVLIPRGAQDWPDERIAVVLRHELAHIRRHDWLVQVSAEALLTLAWFNPLMWMACARLRRESEQACDDIVLGGGVRARDYAELLLALARTCRRPDFPWTPAMPIARSSTLERRITAMLNPDLNRAALSRRAAAATLCLLAAIILPVAAVRAVQDTPSALTGTAYDTTGGVLPGVELTLEGAANTAAKTTTDAAGRFVFPGIAPGRYVLAAALPGFRTLRHEFELKTTRDWDRAVTLQVGDLTETIMVQEKRLAVAGPTQPQGAQRIRVGGNIRVPRKLLDVHPIYPQTMREAGREGVVPIEAIIGTDGTVTSLRVLSAQVHPDFAIAASDAVRQWRFSPTLLNGSPVEVVMRVSITFSLSD